MVVVISFDLLTKCHLDCSSLYTLFMVYLGVLLVLVPLYEPLMYSMKILIRNAYK